MNTAQFLVFTPLDISLNFSLRVRLFFRRPRLLRLQQKQFLTLGETLLFRLHLLELRHNPSFSCLTPGETFSFSTSFAGASAHPIICLCIAPDQSKLRYYPYIIMATLGERPLPIDSSTIHGR